MREIKGVLIALTIMSLSFFAQASDRHGLEVARFELSLNPIDLIAGNTTDEKEVLLLSDSLVLVSTECRESRLERERTINSAYELTNKAAAKRPYERVGWQF